MLFKVLQEGGNVVSCIDEDGAEISADSCIELARLLRFHATALRVATRAQMLTGLLPSARWLFPTRTFDYRGWRSCVYFISLRCRPAEIKIGMTTNSVTSRLRQYRTVVGEVPFPIAVIKHENPKVLEAAFHAYFSAHRIGAMRSEYFEYHPVMEYLMNIRSTLNEQSL